MLTSLAATGCLVAEQTEGTAGAWVRWTTYMLLLLLALWLAASGRRRRITAPGLRQPARELSPQ